MFWPKLLWICMFLGMTDDAILMSDFPFTTNESHFYVSPQFSKKWLKLLQLQQYTYKTSFYISFDTSNREVIRQNPYRPIFRKQIFIYKKSYGVFKEKNIRLGSFLEYRHICRRPWGPNLHVANFQEMIKVWLNNLSSWRYPAKYEVQQFPRLLDCYFQRYKALHFQIGTAQDIDII